MIKKSIIALLFFFLSTLWSQELEEDDEYEYGIVPNYSVNLYTGYPVVKAESFETYDVSRPVVGLSVGTPFGYYASDFFINVNLEIFNYIFSRSVNDQKFGGTAFQVGANSGLFIGDVSISLTAATGVFHAGTGFIAGGSIDLPVGGYIADSFDLPESLEPHIQAFEMRLTTRSNIVQKSDGTTGWVDAGVSLGYEF
tara:strand:- start:54055 stop:54645 length:591 start_codon:yes stop_codon:yes gene_type:complete